MLMGWIRSQGCAAALCAGLIGPLAPAAVRAQSALVDARPMLPSDKAAERARHDQELADIQARLRASESARTRLAAEIETIRRDRAKLSLALVETGARAHAAEERIRTIGERLDTTLASEAALRRSLESRRGTLADVLGALERMGRRMPPALLVRPEDVRAAIRTSMLLGAVFPELRNETAAVAADLVELVRLRGLMADQRDTLRAEFATLAAERERLAALVGARQQRLGEAESESGAERSRAESLAREAGSLKELVDRLDVEIASASRAAERERRLAEERERKAQERIAAASSREPIRLAPRLAFADARGSLPRPVVGVALREFGAPDGLGGSMRGSLFSTRPGAVVTAACDGWVSFAGPFRSLGRLLIINAGGGYYVVLAGLNQVSVDVGQFVLAGEPVGSMGDRESPSAAFGAIETEGPVLYVEFRKDGGPVDPGPWWATRQVEKVRG